VSSDGYDEIVKLPTLVRPPALIRVIMVGMKDPVLEDIETLMIKLVFPFYQVKRDAVPPIEPRRFENDVEHSWSVAFLACSLAPEIDKSLDLGKIAQFAIVHDLVEVFSGDTSPWHEKGVRESKAEREKNALHHIEEQFKRFHWIAQTIKEYESRKSNEAKFVWAVDKIIILLMRYADKGRYYVENGITKQLFDERLTDHRKKAHAHPKIGGYYDQLLELFEQHPEYFSQVRADA
jgi:5'-deoxynucleotidase YfbR-like HD superfamily hydrolase